LRAEVKFIAEADLQTMDALWSAASGGKFGFTAQRELWLQQSKYWSRFFKKIDWTQVRLGLADALCPDPVAAEHAPCLAAFVLWVVVCCKETLSWTIHLAHHGTS